MRINPPQYQIVQLRRFLLEKIVNKYYQLLLQESIPAMDNTGIWNSGSTGRDLTWILPHSARTRCTCQKLKRSTLPSPASRRAGRPRPLRPPCPRLPGHGWTVQISWTVIECDLITNRVLFHEYIYIYPLLLWIFFSVVCSQKLLWPKMVQVAKVGDCRCVVSVVSYQDYNQLNEFCHDECFIYPEFVHC